MHLPEGFDVLDVSADGNCFYHAILQGLQLLDKEGDSLGIGINDKDLGSYVSQQRPIQYDERATDALKNKLLDTLRDVWRKDKTALNDLEALDSPETRGSSYRIERRLKCQGRGCPSSCYAMNGEVLLVRKLLNPKNLELCIWEPTQRWSCQTPETNMSNTIYISNSDDHFSTLIPINKEGHRHLASNQIMPWVIGAGGTLAALLLAHHVHRSQRRR